MLPGEQYLSFNRYWKDLITEKDAELFTDLGEVAVKSLPLPEGELPLHGMEKEADKLIVKRLVPGTLMSLARVPAKERRSPFVIPDLLYMLFDGEKTLLECMRLFSFEMDKEFDDASISNFVEFLRYLEKYGYVSLTYKD